MKNKYFKMGLVGILILVFGMGGYYALSQNAKKVELVKENNLKQLNDGFEGEKLDSKWKIFDPHESLDFKMMDAENDKKSSDHLEFFSSEGGWWFFSKGPFIYQEVTGDFLVTSRIHIKGVKGEMPGGQWTLSGMLVREKNEAASSLENWTYLMIGTGYTDSQVVDMKNTIKSESEFDVGPLLGEWVTLGMFRLGDTLIGAYKPDGGEWTIHTKYFQNPFSETVQVGMANLGNWDKEIQCDILGYYDFMNFYKVAINGNTKELLKEDKEGVYSNLLEILNQIDK